MLIAAASAKIMSYLWERVRGQVVACAGGSVLAQPSQNNNHCHTYYVVPGINNSSFIHTSLAAKVVVCTCGSWQCLVPCTKGAFDYDSIQTTGILVPVRGPAEPRRYNPGTAVSTKPVWPLVRIDD